MYNEELKKEFIKYKNDNATHSPFFIENLFNQTEPFEEERDKDLCNFTVKEIIEFYKFKGSVSDVSLANINGMFKKYTQFCIEKGMSIDNQNHFLEITDQILQDECINKAMLKRMIVTRQELLSSLYKFSNPSDRFLLLALFEGMWGKDYSEILDLNIADFEGNMVHLSSGRTIPVSDILIQYAKESAEKTEYTNASTGRTWKLYGEYGQVIKRRNGGEVKKENRGRVLYQRLYKLTAEMDVSNNITARYIRNSGQIDMFKRKAKEKDISVIDAIYDNEIFDEVSYIYGKINSRKNFINKFKEYL